jgi:tetratricopeptide (TPR) repeat protein
MAPVIPEAVETNRAKPGWPHWLQAAGLVAAVVLCYGISLWAPFLFDDMGAVVNNPTIRRMGSWAVLNPPSDGTTTTGRPVVNLTFAVNEALGGEVAWGFHALNVAIHALTALALLGIVRRTLSGPVLRDRFGAKAQPLAFFAALLWAVHPLLTESVTCIAQRTESLCGLFYLLTLYTFIRAAVPDTPTSDLSGKSSRSWFWFGLAIISCLLGMGSKEIMVTAPVIVLLYDRTFVAGSFAAAWRRRWTWHLAFAGTWLLLAWLVMGVGGSRGASAGFGFGLSWWRYLLTQCEALVMYFKLCFWPYPLVLDYGTVAVHSVAEVWWQGIAVLACLGLTIWALIRKPVAGFLGAWFFVILSPSSSIVPLVGQTMAEHRMYLPLAGIVVLVLVSADRWLGPRGRWVLAAVAVGLGVGTVLRNCDYLDILGIWADTVAKYPLNARAQNNYAGALERAGRIDEANVHFARAIALEPGYVSAHYCWGVALLDQKRTREAITEFQFVVGLAPTRADGYVNLGNALMQVQREPEALAAYTAAAILRPGPDTDYDLGVVLVALGRGEEAAGHFRAALRQYPTLAEAHYQLARLADKAGRLAEAEREYLATLHLDPDHAEAHDQLGLLLARTGRLAPAAEHFRKVIRLQPKEADAHGNLGNVLLLQGHPREAIACYEESLRLRPNDPLVLENLQIARQSLPH